MSILLSGIALIAILFAFFFVVIVMANHANVEKDEDEE